MFKSCFRWALAAALPVCWLLATLILQMQPPAAQAQGGGAAYVPGEVIVQFKPGTTPPQQQAALAQAQASAKANLPRAGLVLATTPQAVPTAVSVLSRHPNVAFAQPNFIYTAVNTPNDPYLSPPTPNLWGLNNTGQNGYTPNADIDAPEAWNLNTGGRSTNPVVVADIDTGMDYNHPDLAANRWTNPGEIAGNGLDDDHNGYVDDVYGIDVVNSDSNPMDDNNHGTHTAGTIGAVGNNGIGVVGVNWNVKIIACKFLNAAGSGTTAGAVACVKYVTDLKNHGVNVICSNNSWGGGGFDQALYNEIKAARDAGILFIAAAGNNSGNNDVSPFYPATYDLDNIIAVAAVDYNNNKASFSNYGATTVDLGAPGVNILSTVPGGYAYFNGTSMATPHVSGAVALLHDLDPTLSAADIKSRILSTVDPLPSLGGKCVSGGGLNLRRVLDTAWPAKPSPPPAAPTNLQATPDNAQVTLQWNASAGATSYNVKRSTTNGSGYATIQSVTSPSYSDTTALNGTTYYYVVTAVNNSGESGNSNQASATPQVPPQPPTAPSNLTAANAGNKRIALTWKDNASNETGFEVWRSTNPNSGFALVATLGASAGVGGTVQYTNTTPLPNTTYYFQVRAISPPSAFAGPVSARS